MTAADFDVVTGPTPRAVHVSRVAERAPLPNAAPPRPIPEGGDDPPEPGADEKNCFALG
jgi:hypothetical protein